MDLKVRLE